MVRGLPLWQPNDVFWVWPDRTSRLLGSSQERWRDVPVLSGVCDDRNALFVVTGQHPDQSGTALWAKRDTIADPELQHLRMCPHLAQKSKALNNPVVEVGKLRFGELINIDLHDGIHTSSDSAYISGHFVPISWNS